MIVIKYASRGRKAKFLQRMAEIQQRTRTKDYLIVVTIDENDAEMVAIIDYINSLPNTAGYIIKPFGKIAAINAYIPWHKSWDVLVNYSDDFDFVDGWDEIMMQRIKSVWPNTTDYCAHFSDGFVFERLVTMSVLGREYVERFGWIYPPMYKSVSCDAEQFYVSQMLGKYHYFDKVIAFHEHPVNKKGVAYDQTYRDNDKFADADTALYFKRMRQNFYLTGVDTSIIEKHKR